jgi:NedA-like, galactose-binding domain
MSRPINAVARAWILAALVAAVFLAPRLARATGNNIAPGKKLSYSAQNSTRPASRAIDGNTNSKLSGNSIAEIRPTSSSSFAYLQVDLGEVRQVQSIEIYNTTESCAAVGGSCAMDSIAVIASEIPILGGDTESPRIEVTNVPMTGKARTLAVNNASSDHQRLVFLNRPVRYLKLVNRRAGVKFYLSELRIYEADSAGGGRSAWMSSTSGTRTADKAVDGKTSTASSSNSIAQTNSEVGASWSADLWDVVPIRQIDVRIRSDSYTMPPATLFVSSEPFASESWAATLNDPKVTSFPLGGGNATRFIAVNKNAEYVRVQLDGGAAGVLALAEVQVWTVNRSALYARASQSSTYGNAKADLVVDGNTDGNYYDGSVAHGNLTSSGATPGLMLDFGAPRTIQTLNIWNRTDCCKDRLGGFYVFTSATHKFKSSEYVADLQTMPGVTQYYFPFASVGGASLISLPIFNADGSDPNAAYTRYIKIQLGANDYLHIAEVEAVRRRDRDPNQ